MKRRQSDSAKRPPKYASLLALLITAPVQFVGTMLAMVVFPDSIWAKVGFGVAKILLMAAPVVWLIAVEKSWPRIPPFKNLLWGKGIIAAHVSGVLIFATIAIVYYVGNSAIDTSHFRHKIVQMGLSNLWIYLVGALYWCTANSLLEEYFWRWFIYQRLREIFSSSSWWAAVAIGLCGLLFTAHHVVALRVYFSWPITLLACLGVFAGGVVWSLLYWTYNNIYACYVSHVYADVIIFYVGYELIFAHSP